MATNDQQSFEYELVPQQNSANFHNSDNNNGTSTHRSPNRNSTTAYVMESGSTSKQYIAAFAGNLVAFTAGICLTWTSPCLLKLYEFYETDSPLDRQITEDEKSWISSLCPLASVVGPFFGGFLADKIGPKKTLLGSAAPLIIGFILIATTKTVIQIYIARVLWGLSIGTIFTVLPMYNGEIAQDEVRGALGSMMNLFICFGILWSSAVGNYTDWYVFTYLSMAVPILFLVLFFFMPESPYYLCGQNREAAVESLMFLRSKSNDGVQKELEQITCIVEESKQQTGTFLDLFKTIGRRKGMMLSCGLVGFQQLSGINAVLFFSGTIFLAAGQQDAALSSVVLGIVQVVSSGITPLVVDRLGRRILLLISGIGMCIGLVCLGWYFNLQKTQDVSAIKMMPVVSLIVYMIVYCIGFGPLPWAVMGELFSNNVKSKASTLTASFCWLLGFFITKYFESVKNELGDDITFWFFAVMCVIATIFVYLLLPETKGKSLEEIQMILEDRQK